MYTTKTPVIHAFAKSVGIKNLKASGRTREVIIAEIIEKMGWQSHDEQTVDFLLNGGTITECKPEPTPKADVRSQSSAGKTKSKKKDTSRARFVVGVQLAIDKLSDHDKKQWAEYIQDKGVWPAQADTQIWGDGGLCDHAAKFGLMVKVPPTTEKVKVEKVAGVKRNRTPASKDGLVSLSSLCEKFGVDSKVARRKLRLAMEKPEQGWHFTPDQVDDVVKIITK